jgi:hypothetical protein
VDAEAEERQSRDPRRSGVRLAVSVAIKYTRLRETTTDRFEARLSSAGLLLLGGICAVFMLYLVARVLSLIP